MRNIVIVIMFFIIIVALGCGQSNEENILETTLTISNESFSELTDVRWRGTAFADNWAPLSAGKSIKKTVEPGEGFLFFSRVSNPPIAARTRELVVVEEGKDNIARLLDHTLVIEALNPGNTGTLRDLIPAAPQTDFTADTAIALLNIRQQINNAAAGTYTITITNSFELSSGIEFTGTGKTIIVRGDTIPRSIFTTYSNQYSNQPGIFIVSSGVTLELGNNIALNGIDGVGNSVTLVRNNGVFIMNAGSTISGRGTHSDRNTGIESRGTFTMNGGTIRNNGEGGVLISGGAFNMNGGTISGNYGGVFVHSGAFYMNGGTIEGNKKQWGSGGGVYVGNLGYFLKTGGIIDETNEAPQGGRVAYVQNGSKRRESTAGPSDILDSTKTGVSGGWE